MSIRRRSESRKKEGRVLSHSINIAASISKYRVLPNDTDIFIDSYTFRLLNKDDFEIEGPQQRWLEKLGKIQPIYKINIPQEDASSTSVLDEDVTQQQELLAAYRKTLFLYLRQQARLGTINTTPAISLSIDEARDNIRQIKKILKSWNIIVDDHPNDEPSPSS